MADNFRIHEPSYRLVFENKDGIVGRDLDKRAERIMQAAKRQVGVRTGALQRSIKRQWTRSNGKKLTVSVGSNKRYAAMHHDGTRPHVIRARGAKPLRFIGSNGDVVFARSVNHPGTRANRYLTDNLRLAAG